MIEQICLTVIFHDRVVCCPTKYWLKDASLICEWSDKYYSDYSDASGSHSSRGQNLSYNTIFDGFFGNTVAANKEFLPELLGYPGYEAADTEKTNGLMKTIVTTYLSNPQKYKGFAKGIIQLTADGTYIGTTIDDPNNMFNNDSVKYNGYSYDKYILACLASFYKEVDEYGEPYLNEAQNKWVESYTHWLYTDYADRSSSSIAAKYPKVYDLIARSSYASNNERGLGNRFFEYVVNSGFGGGKWLNQNNNINIVGLDGWDNLVTLIEYAGGWCGQHERESDCTYRAECGSEFNKGTDPIVYALMKNGTADAYLKYASKTNKVYCNRKDRDNPDYLTRFKNKHMGVGAEPGLLGSRIMVANKPYSNTKEEHKDGTASTTYSASIKGTTSLYAHPNTNEIFFKNGWTNSYLGGYKTGEYVKGTDNKSIYKCISAIPEATKWSDKEMSVNGYGYIARPIADDKGNLIRYEIYRNNSYYPYSFDTWDKNKQYKNGDITKHAVGEVAHLFKNVYTSSINPITWDKKSIDISNGRYIVVGTGKDRKYYKYIGTKRLYFVSWEKDHTYYKGDLVKDGNATYTALVSNPDKTKKPSANKTEWEKSTSYTYKEPANDKNNWLAVSCFNTSKDYTNDLWEDMGKFADLKPNKNTDQWSYCYDLVNPSKDTTHWTSVDVDNSLGNMFADNAKYILFPKTVAFTAHDADNGGVQGAPENSTKNLTTMKIETDERTIPQKELTFSPGYFGFKPKMDSSGRVVIKDGKIVSSGDYDYETFFIKGNNPKYSFVGTDGNTYTGTYSGTDTQWDTKVSAKQIGTALYLGDLEMLSNERKTAKLVIHLSSTQYQYYNGLGYGGGSTSATIDFPNWCYTIRAPKDCAIKNHKYTSKVVWESEVRKGVTHYPRAHFEHVCEKCLHTLEPEKADVIPELSADGTQITYNCTDPLTKQKFRRVVYLSGQSGNSFKLNGNTKITGTPKAHPCKNESTGTNTVHAAGSKSQAKWGGIYKEASTSVSFTIPAGYIQAGAQSITLKYAYSENLEDLNILLKDRKGNTIATNKNHGTISSKIDLSKGYIDDSKLNGAYLTIDARVSTKTYAATDDSEPANAYTFIRFDTLEVRY